MNKQVNLCCEKYCVEVNSGIMMKFFSHNINMKMTMNLYFHRKKSVLNFLYKISNYEISNLMIQL